VSEGVALLTVFVLAVFVGFEVVSKVSSTLHTPLMSGANAIHGVVLVGAVIVAGSASGVALVVALVAVVLATVNLVGGFVVTDRMLEMFRGSRSPRPPRPRDDLDHPPGAERSGPGTRSRSSEVGG
jgi:NAD(P) transhydrogenase subunit alpha